MKLERTTARVARPQATEVLGHEQERSELLFDPRKDFDPEVKRRMLEDLVDPTKRYGPDIIGIEYFYALFPDEFASLQQAEWKEKTELTIQGSDIESSWDKLYLGEKYTMLFPGSAKEISQYLDKTYIKQILQRGPTGPLIYLHASFLQEFLFHEQPREAEARAADWEKALLALPVVKRGMTLVGYMRSLAYLRLLFPEKDLQPLITPELQVRFKRALQAAAETEGAAQRIPPVFEVKYPDLAWSATILSAETVGITSDGRIQYEMPKKSISYKPQLPVRSVI